METALAAIIGRFAVVGQRARAAADLATYLGAKAVLCFVRDPELGVPLPAPGFAPTVRGDATWRAFVERLASPGWHDGEVTLDATVSRVLAHTADDGATFVLVGGTPDRARVEAFLPAWPALAALFCAELASRLSAGEAALARDVGRRARDLALALEDARADQQRALRETAMLNEQLVDADRRKDEFLAMLGHELRNPMSAIGGALDVIRVRRDDAPAVERAIAVITRQSKQLARLVDDLLDVARVTRGRIDLRLAPVDLDVVVRCAIEATHALVTSKRQSLRVHGRPSTWVRADAARVEQMVTNLLTNAAKYTDPEGAIDVAIEVDGDNAVIRVSDTGIGIDAASLPLVFEPFVQVAPAIERAHGGMGIGLTLVRQLATLHGGRVDATSKVGVGSEFSIRLPLIEAPAAAKPAEAEARSRARRVLVVDDNVDSAQMLTELLATWGHDTSFATDGSSALEVVQAIAPDVVILDIGLPGLDGYEVARRIRAMPTVAKCRLVALSGYGSEADRRRSREAGFDAHLVKPVDFAAIERALA